MDSQFIPVSDHNPISEISWADPQRAQVFKQWLAPLAGQFGIEPQSLRPASVDASFRRYFRLSSSLPENPTLIVMDAPPQQEDCRPFVRVDQLMKAAGLRVPDILDWDEANGFMLLSDLGNQTVLETVNAGALNMALAHQLLTQACDILVRWQLASQPGTLLAFDEPLLRRDLNLFPEWYVAQYRQISLTPEQQKVLAHSFDLIIQRNLASASVYMHRDYMPRNLMVGGTLPNGQTAELGVLDFQDAVYGPISYDIASLMRDAFHSWEEEFVLDITIRYWEMARKAGLPVPADFSEFWVAVEWMGLQRHLKILGIFARLTLRDGKPKYLADTPRFINYVRATCARYRELAPLLKLVDQIESITPQFGYTF